MLRESIKSQLVQQGFDSAIAEEFSKACTFIPLGTGPSRGPERLMETLVVGRGTGSLSYSVKPYNLIINIPRLIASALALAYGAANTGDILGLFLGAAGVVASGAVNLGKNDAAVVLALHDLDAYAGKGRYLEESAVLAGCARYGAAWSLAPIDQQKLRESINTLRGLGAVALRDDKVALQETVVTLQR